MLCTLQLQSQRGQGCSNEALRRTGLPVTFLKPLQYSFHFLPFEPHAEWHIWHTSLPFTRIFIRFRCRPSCSRVGIVLFANCVILRNSSVSLGFPEVITLTGTAPHSNLRASRSSSHSTYSSPCNVGAWSHRALAAAPGGDGAGRRSAQRVDAARERVEAMVAAKNG